jgi:hypothetical protein
MLKDFIFTFIFLMSTSPVWAQSDVIKISCNTNIKESYIQTLVEVTRKEVITIQLIDKGDFISVDSVSGNLKFSFGSTSFIDKFGKIQKTKQFNSSDYGRWDILELRAEIKSGNWFHQSLQIDRNSGIFNYSQLNSNRILEAEGKCSKVDTRNRKF